MNICVSITVLVLVCVGHVSAQNLESAISKIAPTGVRLGLDSEELKANRPKVYQGPSAAMSDSPKADSNQFQTYMEAEGIGKPGHVSYWYLLAQNKVVGVLKTNNLIGIEEEDRRVAAQRLFSEFTALLGGSQQESILRKGETAFVPVRADSWKDMESGTEIYFIATDKEITVAALAKSDFPIAQVFIRPNAERFPLEDPKKVSIRDIDRPDSTKIPITQPSLQTPNTPDVRGTPSAEAEPIDQLPRQPIANHHVLAQNEKEHSFPFTVVFGVGLAVFVALALIVIFFKRRC